jgi:trehalose-6-phosphatase
MSTGTAGASLADHAARLSARADQVALCLDFDGTLSWCAPASCSAR